MGRTRSHWSEEPLVELVLMEVVHLSKVQSQDQLIVVINFRPQLNDKWCQTPVQWSQIVGEFSMYSWCDEVAWKVRGRHPFSQPGPVLRRLLEDFGHTWLVLSLFVRQAVWHAEEHLY